MLLLNKKKLTAKELSEYFEVSVRTIQRDIDSLCSAGIPIYGDVGKYGGYQLTENYKMDRTFLSEKEMDSLVIMLKGFSDTLFSDSIRTILEKMNGFDKKGSIQSNMHIDLTPWGSSSEFQAALNLINQSIEEKNIISFDYYDLYNNQTIRKVEPYITVLKGGSWYLYAYCLLRENYRLFKICRIFDLNTTCDKFVERDDIKDFSAVNKVGYSRKEEQIKFRFSPEAKGRIPDFFDPREAVKCGDGSILYNISFPIDEWLISIILGLGEYVEILEPEFLREEIKNRIKKSILLYKL